MVADTGDVVTQSVRILLVEDNPADAELTQIMLRRAKVANAVSHVETAEEAIARIDDEDTRPDLVLLDLNLPGRPGTDVLEHVKTDPDLRRIPVVVLSSSQAASDIARSYDLAANAYVTKPIDLEQFGTVIRAIDDFWLVAVRLPE